MSMKGSMMSQSAYMLKLYMYIWRLQDWFFPFDVRIIQEEAKYQHVTDADDYQRQTEMMAVLDGSAELSAEEERQLGMAQLPREMSKHTGFSFDSPGFESFFAMQEGVHDPARSRDIARSAIMRPHRTHQIYAAKARRKSMVF